jgi:hypothetical protein
MEKYTYEGTARTPTINFDFSTGVLEIKGRSIPENALEFYQPLIEALEKYSGSVKPTTIATVSLEYFNTSSAKRILDVFKKLEEIKKAGSAVSINWFYEEDDEDMLGAAQDYEALVNIPFTMVPIAV